jgi:hypothetical protein
MREAEHQPPELYKVVHGVSVAVRPSAVILANCDQGFDIHFSSFMPANRTRPLSSYYETKVPIERCDFFRAHSGVEPQPLHSEFYLEAGSRPEDAISRGPSIGFLQ